MRTDRFSSFFTAFSFIFCLMAAICASGQASYTAQIRGVVKDASGALVPQATITITNNGTGISTTAHTDNNGLYILTGLRPAVYTIRAEGPGFRASEQNNVVLQVDQQTSIDFTLHPLGVITTVEVTEAAPLLDTESAAIGTDVTNQYVRDIPLYGRNPFALVFLAGGVTETTGSDLGYPAGTNFVSNGQRNATAQITLDGSPLSAPEQGEGGNSNVYYQPSVEIVQEFKVQNNSFSAEFGNNGGTIVTWCSSRVRMHFMAAVGGMGNDLTLMHAISSTRATSPTMCGINMASRSAAPSSRTRHFSLWISKRFGSRIRPT